MGVSTFEGIAHLGTPEVVTYKIDGEQTGVYVHDGHVELVSRHGKVRTDLPVIKELEAMLVHVKEALFIGELYVVDNSGAAIPYPKAISTLRNPKGPEDESRIRIYMVDIADIAGHQYNSYGETVAVLDEYFKGGSLVSPVITIPKEMIEKAWNNEVLTNHYEGFVIHYAGGKVYKVKPIISFDLAVVFVELSANLQDQAGALGLAFMDPSGAYRMAGRVGTGFSSEARTAWLEWAKSRLIRQTGPVLWAKPEIVVEVVAKGANIRLTDCYDKDMNPIGERMSGVLREPSFRDIREDKSIAPEDLRLEQIPGWEGDIKTTASYPVHPDTVIVPPNEWHQQGIDEKAIWEHYDNVADKMVPLLKGYEIIVKAITPAGPVLIRHDPKTHGFIKIDSREDFDRWNNGRNVEFHRALGPETRLAWIDLDPRKDYPKEEMMRAIDYIKEHIYDIMEPVSIDVVYSGGRGYHVYFNLKEPMPVNEARSSLYGWLNAQVVPNFKKTSTGIIKGDDEMRFDVTTLKNTGSLRCPYSLNASTGKVAMPERKDIEKQASFDKISYIVHMPGHKNSKGESAPYVIKSHETDKIIGSYKNRGAAEHALKMMRVFKHKANLISDTVADIDKYVNDALIDLYSYLIKLDAGAPAFIYAITNLAKTISRLINERRLGAVSTWLIIPFLKMAWDAHKSGDPIPSINAIIESQMRIGSLTPKNIKFEFDPNSTQNEGRFRLRDPKDFDKDSFKRWTEWAGVKPVEGIGYVVGEIDGKKVLQAIRFNRAKFNEESAGKFWQKVKDMPGFEKHWVWERKATYVGTVGFNNHKWDGSFYPAEIKENERLKYYAMHFPVVEINATANSIPRRDVFERWASQVGHDFKFVFRVTYNKDIKDNMELLARRAFDTIGAHRFGAVCITIPSEAPYYSGAVEALFKSIPKFKYALDIRSEGWLNTEVLAVVTSYGGTIVRDHLLGGIINSDWEYIRLPVVASLKAAGLSTNMNVFSSVLTPLPEEKNETFIFTKDEVNDQEADIASAPGKAKKLIQLLKAREPSKIIDLRKELGPNGPDTYEGRNNAPTKSADTEDIDGPLFERKKSTVNEGPDIQDELTQDTAWVDCVDKNNGLSEPAEKKHLR